jgi:hypothetical protein
LLTSALFSIPASFVLEAESKLILAVFAATSVAISMPSTVPDTSMLPNTLIFLLKVSSSLKTIFPSCVIA